MLVNPDDPKRNLANVGRGGKPPFGPTDTAQALQEPDDDSKKKLPPSVAKRIKLLRKKK